MNYFAGQGKQYISFLIDSQEKKTHLQLHVWIIVLHYNKSAWYSKEYLGARHISHQRTKGWIIPWFLNRSRQAGGNKDTQYVHIHFSLWAGKSGHAEVARAGADLLCNHHSSKRNVPSFQHKPPTSVHPQDSGNLSWSLAVVLCVLQVSSCPALGFLFLPSFPLCHLNQVQFLNEAAESA